MVGDVFRRMLYPAMVATVIATVWVVAWSHSMRNTSSRVYWPSLVNNQANMQSMAQ